MTATRRGRAAWLLAAVSVLTGLMGMHGLAAGATPATPHPMSASAMHGALTATTTHLRVATVLGHRRGGAVLVAVGSGCGMDHAGCVAVLRADPRVGPPATAGSPPDPLHRVVVRWWASPAAGSRGPPQVSLVGLGISRT